jgi:hypothetical protein
MDLVILDPDGNYVTDSCSWDSTSEIVEFTTQKSGTYTVRISVFQCNERRDALKLGYAYWESQ